MDTISRAERSSIMSRVRHKNTSPEMKTRRILRRLGFHYRLHRADLPGKPDIVFAGRRKVIFVHGCFWHRHEGCALARMPKSRVDFWQPKLEANRRRDERVIVELNALGWRVMIVWECELRDEEFLAERLRGFLGEEFGVVRRGRGPRAGNVESGV